MPISASIRAALALDAYEDKYVLFGSLAALANRIQAAGDRQFVELTWKQWFALLGISIFKQPPGIRQLASVLGTSHQNLKQILLRLEKAGYVDLVTDAADKRKTRVHLTAQVAVLERKYRAASAAFMARIYQDIALEDIAVTSRTIQKMDENLRGRGGPGQTSW